MQRYALNPKPETSVKVFGRGLRISATSAAIVCRQVSGMSLPKAQSFLERLLSGQQSIGGKFYTSIATELAGLLKLAEANADFKGLPAERLFLHASVHEGFTFRTPRKFSLRGRKKRIANIQLVLQQR